jgi:hypothetical protein
MRDTELRAPANPAGNPQLSRHWNDAASVGFKLLRCPRLAISASADLRGDWYIAASYDIVKRFGACSRVIESGGCGMRHLDALEAKNPRATPPWHEAIAAASVAEATAITKAVAEWTDGDTVAAHYAYANDYVCTANPGTGGTDAILSTVNRESILAKINMRFVTPEELAALI